MKLNIPTVSVERGPIAQEESFGIGNLALILNILRSKMYPDPIKTIVQEIASNARDAHREVGKADIPIEITLPNTINSDTFQVRDFGPGISPARMTDVFLLYGESTKRNSNDETGGFGLGAKTPFSYNDSFSIVSITPQRTFEDETGIHENCMVRREYIAYIDESRIGKLAFCNEVITDEAQGTTIVVPCKPGDESQFTDAIVQKLQYWSVLPKIYGRDFIWPEIKKRFEGDKWYMVEGYNHISYSSNSIVALIDGIPYTINRGSVLSQTDSRDNNHNTWAAVERHHTYLSFDVGEIPVTSNREDIDYADDQTKQAIILRVEEVYRELEKICSDTVASAVGLWEANIKFKECQDVFNLSATTWKGISVSGLPVSFRKYGASQWLFKRNLTGGFNSSSANASTPSKDTLVVQDDNPDDTKTPSRARISAVFEAYPGIHNIFVVRLMDKQATLAAAGQDTEKIQKINDAFDSFDKDSNFDKYDALLLSTFEKGKKAKGQRTISTVTKAYVFCDAGWDAIDPKTITSGAYYVPISNRKAIINGVTISNHELEQMAEHMPEVQNTEIVGIPVRFVKAAHKFKLLEDAINNKIKAIKKDVQFVADSSANSCTFSVCLNYHLRRFLEDLMPRLTDASVIKRFKKASDLYLNVHSKLKSMQEVARIFAVQPDGQECADPYAEALTKAFYEFRERYPLIVLLDGYQCNRDNSPELLLDYLDMCDKQHELKTQAQIKGVA